MPLIVIQNDFDRYSGILSSLFRMPLIVIQDAFHRYFIVIQDQDAFDRYSDDFDRYSDDFDRYSGLL